MADGDFVWSREDYFKEINKANIVLFDLYRDIEAGRISTVNALHEVKHRIRPLMDRFNGVIGTLHDREGEDD